MMRRLLLLITAAVLAMPVSAQAAEAAEAQVTPAAYVVQDRGRGSAENRISLSEVVARLRRSRQGSMVDANESVRGGRPVYVVIWQYPGGRIGNIYVDQRTGAVLGED